MRHCSFKSASTLALSLDSRSRFQFPDAAQHCYFTIVFIAAVLDCGANGFVAPQLGGASGEGLDVFQSFEVRRHRLHREEGGEVFLSAEIAAVRLLKISSIADGFRSTQARLHPLEFHPFDRHHRQIAR